MFRAFRSPWPTRVLLAISLASFAGVAMALIAQHRFDVRPCSWCVFQRGLYLLVGLIAALGALGARWPRLQTGAIAMVLVTALGGLVATAAQARAAADTTSLCAYTFPEKVIGALGLDMRWPDVFMSTATCVEAGQYRLLGLPYELWSALLYGSMACACVWLLLRSRR